MPHLSKEVEEHQKVMMDMIADYCGKYPEILTSVELLDFAGRLMVVSSQCSKAPPGVVVRVSGIEYLTLCRALSPEELEKYYNNKKNK